MFSFPLATENDEESDLSDDEDELEEELEPIKPAKKQKLWAYCTDALHIKGILDLNFP